MKTVQKILLLVFFLVIIGVLGIIIPHILSQDPNTTYELRGRYKSSEDGKTYLVVEDDNGGQCGPLYVDKKQWPHGLNKMGQIEPGKHRIECGTWIGINIKEGTTYYFDYWGP